MIRQRRIIVLVWISILSVFILYEFRKRKIVKNYRHTKDFALYDLIDSKDEEEIDQKYPYPYKFILDEPEFCNTDIQVVNMIPVRPEDKNKRDVIRTSWGAKDIVASTKLKPLFIVGASQTPEGWDNLKKESSIYHDIIQIDIIDSYLNLTLKSLSFLHWKQTRCQHVPWLLKSDTDVFINPWTVTKVLSETKKDFVCRVLTQRFVCRVTNKHCKKENWVIPRNVYPHDRYPPYCNGPAYALNQRAVQSITASAYARKEHFAMEDIYCTGILAQGLNLQYYNIGSRMHLYHLYTPPYDDITSGKDLFVVDFLKKGGGTYTHEDLWNHLMTFRNS